MTEDITPVVDQEPEPGHDVLTQDTKTFDLAYVQDLRKENAKYRTKAKDLEQQKKDAEEATLTQQQEWQKLAEQRQAKIAELEPYQERYDGMITAVAESNTKRVASIPETMRQLVPDFEDPLKLAGWLDANSQLLTKPVAPTVNGSAGSIVRPGDAEQLSAEELAVARKMGLTAQEYQKEKRG